MFVCVYMIGQIVGSTIYTVVAQLIVGVTVYFGLLLLLRDPFVLSGARMALGQLRTSKPVSYTHLVIKMPKNIE